MNNFRLLEAIVDNPVESMYNMTEIILEDIDELMRSNDDSMESLDFIMESYLYLQAYAEKNNINVPDVDLNIKNDVVIMNINGEVNKLFIDYKEQLIKEKVCNNKLKYRQEFDLTYRYEFKENDLERIQLLLNEMRGIINESKVIEEDYKERILKRLEKLQLELHRKMNNLDKFWGLFGEAGVVIGKFGEDVKPFMDRLKELSEIVFKAQNIAEGLPQAPSANLLIEFKNDSGESKNVPLINDKSKKINERNK